MIDETQFPEEALLCADASDAVKKKVELALKTLDAKEVNRFWGVGGSQEINQLLVSISGQQLLLQEETYVGLTALSDRATLNKFLDHLN